MVRTGLLAVDSNSKNRTSPSQFSKATSVFKVLGQYVKFIFHYLNILLLLKVRSFNVSEVGYSELSAAFENLGPTLSRYSLRSGYHEFF